MAMTTITSDLPEVLNIGVPFDTATLDPKFTDHGTATLGLVAGKNNFTGVKGIAHAAHIRIAAKGVFPVDFPFGCAFGLENTIIESFAQSELKPGDVILLETQIKQLDATSRMFS